MPKRNLRVIKWLRTVLAVGVCTFCNLQFKAPVTAMKRVADALISARPGLYGATSDDCPLP
jgi:hypothetical protein